VLDTFCISGTWDTIVDKVAARLGGLTDVVSLSIPATDDPRFDAALAGMKQIPGRR